MPQKTTIEWTRSDDGSPGYTSNLIRYRDVAGKDVWACAKTSPGCAHCYSEAISERFNRGGPFNLATVRTVTPYFSHDEARKIVRSEQLAGRRVFVGDMTDVFGEWVSDELLDVMFATFAMRPDVTFQVLTKRAERMAAYLRWDGHEEQAEIERRNCNCRQCCIAREMGRLMEEARFDPQTVAWAPSIYLWKNWPLPNIWCGVSVEDQTRADARIPHLLRTPAAVRFLSVEPMLGPVDLRRVRWQLPDSIGVVCGGVLGDTDGHRFSPRGASGRGIDWIIVGGESGHGARPMDEQWVMRLRDDCLIADVPFFYKQKIAGGRKVSLPMLDGRQWAEFPKGMTS